jgi:Heterokaryon incompatibility protein (HET)
MGTTRGSRKYRHEPLQSPKSTIRLFSLNATDESYLLSGTLTSHDLSTCGSYVALSYEWGEEEPQIEIKINGQWFLIRHNLWLFLSVIKSKRNSNRWPNGLRFWIDAICINQQDVPERNAQVSFMGRIYQQATSVLAWLGWPQSWDPRMTFDFIRWNCAEAEQESTFLFQGQTYSEMLHMVFRMCTCRYWSRRWIVQEILLATEVGIMCGENELSWIALRSFAQKFARLRISHWQQTVEEYLSFILSRSTREGVETLTETVPFVMSYFWREGGRKHTLRQLFLAFHATDCEVIHDKVYSLLSLASDAGMIPVDYNCLPQNLLYKVIMRGGWSKNRSGIELHILAKALRCIEVPENFRKCKEKKKLDDTTFLPLYLEENLSITHRILFCSIPVSLGEVCVPDRRQIGAASIKQQISGSKNFVRCVTICEQKAVDGKSRFESELEETSDEELNNEEAKRRRRELHVGSGPELQRLFISSDGSRGVSCSNARAGDFLSDFSGGKKLVLRVDRKNSFQIIGTAVVSTPSIPPFLQLAESAHASVTALEEKLRLDDFLQLKGSFDSSSLADILLEWDRQSTLVRIKHLYDLVSSFDAGQRASSYCYSLAHFSERQIVKQVFNVWDLIEVAR